MPNLPVRDRSDAKLLGVCSALARTWAIDPLVVRVAFVVVGLLTNGFVLAVYAMLWAILPERGGVAPLHRMLPSARSWSWGTLATIALLVTAIWGVGMIAKLNRSTTDSLPTATINLPS